VDLDAGADTEVLTMQRTARIIQLSLRVIAFALIALGLLFWSDNALALIPIHMLLGLVLVLGVWAIAVMARIAGVYRPLAVVALAWGLVVPVFGLTQDRLLLGDAHWLVRLAHLLVGLAAVAIEERLALAIRQIRTRQQFSAA
jgi:uncharacterized membrane protein YuzA (DUF378 family)